MAIEKFKNLDESEIDRVVWRYLTFPKYISLITYQALWFAKLNILQDEFEGLIPVKTEEEMRKRNQKWKEFFNHPEFHKQIDEWPKKNIDDGRELTTVNCWFISENESEQMWNEYVEGKEGVAVTSTVRRLSQYVYCEPQFSQIGKVKYVDLSKHNISQYEAHQAQERAFLKDNRFKHEKELRIVTMSIKTPMCLKMDGNPLSSEDCQGKNMNNFENPGLYVRADIRKLVTSTVLAPFAPKWFELLVKRIVELSGIGGFVKRSSLENV